MSRFPSVVVFMLLLGAVAPTITSARAAEVAAPRKEVARYRGILPCADCSALRVELTLFAGGGAHAGTYRERLTYVGARDGDRTFASRGEWKAEHQGGARSAKTLYRLRDAKSGERTLLAADAGRSLRFLDGHGGEIASPMPQVLWRAERRFTGAPVLAGDGAAAGGIALRTGQELDVRLRSNPSTGYRWTMAPATDARSLALDASPSYAADASGKGRVGAGGVETWRFLAAGVGHETLRFEYRRSWEKDVAPARTASFEVTVREGTVAHATAH